MTDTPKAPASDSTSASSPVRKLQIEGSAPTFFVCVARTAGVSYDGSKLIDSNCT